MTQEADYMILVDAAKLRHGPFRKPVPSQPWWCLKCGQDLVREELAECLGKKEEAADE